jgi:hypothetical protein
LTGTGWFLNFDLTGDDLTRVQVFGGLDDGNNSPTNNVMGFGGDGGPDNGIVVGDWTTLVDESGILAGTKSYPITDDLSNYDLMAIRFRGTGATIGATIDDVELTQTPPPPPPPPAQGLINGDFSDPTLKRAGSATYGDLGEGWVGKNAFDDDPGTPDNWQIINEELHQVGNSGSATRAGQIFRADNMTGTGWTFDFELMNDDLNRVQVFAGVDDGDNLSSQSVLSMGGDDAPPDDIVMGTWTTLIDEQPLTLPGPFSFPIADDLSGFDLIAVRFRGSGGTVGAIVDNVAFTAPLSVIIPEPTTFLIWAVGLLGLACYGRRRRRVA